jgi:hypothetical protein
VVLQKEDLSNVSTTVIQGYRTYKNKYH